jgi:hypothetical protein
VPTCYAVRRWGPGLPAVVDSVDHAKELAEYTNARAADVENMWVLNTRICGLGSAQSIMPVFGAFAGGTWVDESKGQAPEGYIWELPHMPTHACGHVTRCGHRPVPFHARVTPGSAAVLHLELFDGSTGGDAPRQEYSVARRC